MEQLKEKLSKILTKKNEEYIEMKEKGMERDIAYPILEEEIKDVEFSLNTLELEDVEERNSKLWNIFSSTTSNSLYKALEDMLKDYKDQQEG